MSIMDDRMGWKMNYDLRYEFLQSGEGLRVADLTLSSTTSKPSGKTDVETAGDGDGSNG